MKRTIPGSVLLLFVLTWAVYAGHALGASIDFRRPSAGTLLEPSFREGSYTSIELNTSTPVSEWDGQKVTIMMKDDAYLTKDGMKWFRPRQTAFYLIR